jgi:RNA polymerase sigma-70 factor, ECF subfamily
MTGESVKRIEGSVSPDSSVEQTSVTLLERIRARDRSAWEKFVQLYTPLVWRWCRQRGLQEADAHDVGQEVFSTVAAAIGKFQRARPGDTFRGWLRVVTRNKVNDFLQKRLEEQPGEGGSDAARLLRAQAEAEPISSEAEAEQADRALVYQRAVEILLADVEERTRQAFWRVVVAGHEPGDVARELGMSVNAIYVLKSRLLRRLREEFAGCVDW